MSTNDPEELRREIDATRSSLSYDVNALADEANPRSIARRQVRKVQSSAWSLRDRLFGSDDSDEGTEYSAVYDPDYYRAGAPGGWEAGYAAGPAVYQHQQQGGTAHHVREGASDVADTVREKAHDVRDAAAEAHRQVRQKTQGAPLTLGLIAFGLGGLVAALLPPSDKERRAAASVKEQAAPLVEEAKSVARESVEHVRPAAEDAVDSVRQTARTGVQEVTEDAQEGARNVRDEASQAKDQVRGGAGGTAGSR